MIHTMHRPRPPLDRFIENIWTAESYHAPSARERILPTGTLAIVIHLADAPMRSYELAKRCAKGWRLGGGLRSSTS